MIKNLQAVNWTEQFDGKSAEDTWIHVQSEQFGLTSVCVKANSRMETFAVFQHVERQRHFDAFALLLNSLQRSLQAKPETDLLQRCTRRRVTVQLRHLNQVQQHAHCHRLHYKSIFQQLFGTDCTGANRSSNGDWRVYSICSLCTHVDTFKESRRPRTHKTNFTKVQHWIMTLHQTRLNLY